MESPRVGSDKVVEELGSPANLPFALGLFLFSLGTLAFLTFHAIVFVQGMTSFFGPAGYLIIFIYMPFYLMAIAFLFSSFEIGAQERITLHGRQLGIMRKVGPISWTTRVQIDPLSVPRIGRNMISISSASGLLPLISILLTDVKGRQVSFGSRMTPESRERLRDVIESSLS